MNNLLVLTVIIFFLFMAVGVTNPINSLYVKSLGANYALIGILGTVGSLTSLLFSYLWGHISDRMAQRKLFLMVGLAGFATCQALMVIVPSYVYLFPLRILGGIAQSAYGTTSLALMGDILERQRGRGRRMGTYRGLASLGFGLMAFVSGSIADRAGLRAPFGLAGGLAAIAFFLSFAIQENLPSSRDAEAQPVAQEQRRGRHKEGATPQATVRELCRRLPMMPLLVSAFLWSLVTGAVYAVWAIYMVEELGYSRTVMSRLWAIASTSEFPLMIVAGWMSDRVGRLPMLSLGFVAWTVVFLGYVVVPMMPWIVLIQLTRGFAYSAYTVTAMTYATEVRSQAERGRASGLFNSAGGLGMVLGSVVGGTLTQLLGFVTMILICGGLIFGGAVYLGGCAVWWNRTSFVELARSWRG